MVAPVFLFEPPSVFFVCGSPSKRERCDNPIPTSPFPESFPVASPGPTSPPPSSPPPLVSTSLSLILVEGVVGKEP
ncbi:MAG: hypothetical protein DMG81_07915 [Acidobacteria bacterium]|nr:MAG: hypothetical protein DMG81_07915 [Acidobacteriota bacterium]